jgi:hypothetical protein
MFKKKIKEERVKTRIEKRVASLPTPELLTWADQIMYTVGRNLSAWQKSQSDFSLEEARVGAEALHAILEALNERSIKK